MIVVAMNKLIFTFKNQAVLHMKSSTWCQLLVRQPPEGAQKLRVSCSKWHRAASNCSVTYAKVRHVRSKKFGKFGKVAKKKKKRRYGHFAHNINHRYYHDTMWLSYLCCSLKLFAGFPQFGKGSLYSCLLRYLQCCSEEFWTFWFGRYNFHFIKILVVCFLVLC